MKCLERRFAWKRGDKQPWNTRCRSHCHSSSSAPWRTSPQPGVVSVASDCSKWLATFHCLEASVPSSFSSFSSSHPPSPSPSLPSCVSGPPQGGICAPVLPGDSLRGDVGRLPSQLEELRDIMGSGFHREELHWADWFQRATRVGFKSEFFCLFVFFSLYHPVTEKGRRIHTEG